MRTVKGKKMKKWGTFILAAVVLLQTVLLIPEPDKAAASPNAHEVSVDLQEVVSEDFLGVGMNIIPASFMEGTSRFGYGESHWEMDKKRILAMKPRVARVWFQTDWMELEKGVYQWDSFKMQEFYKYMDVLQEAGTEVEFNFGWKVGNEIQDWFGFPNLDARISAPADLDAFASAASAALNQLINVKGYDHIKYLTFYNEANGSWDFEAPGDQKAYFAQMVRKVSDKLTTDGLRDLVDIWGPEESGAPDWTQYMQVNADDYFDAYTFHVYGQSYDGLTNSITDRTSVAGGKPVIMTEFGFAEDNSAWNAGLAGSVIKAANMGLKGALIWQLNGVWLPDPYVGNDTNGNYTMWDSLVLGTNPFRRYYESSLLTRYIPPHSTVVSVETDSEDVRAAAFKTGSGDITIVVETNAGSDKEIDIQFNEAVNKTFNKHVYRADVTVEGNTLIPGVSGTFAAGSSFTDSGINGDHNVIVYTTLAPQTQVEVTPVESTVVGGGSQSFSANVIDNTEGVTWTVVGDNNGTITSGGVYTAPEVTEEKLVAIKAVSNENPAGYGIALVKLRPASVSGQADIPEFSLPYGKYSSGEAVTISTATADAEIRYTLDGSTPTGSSQLYTKPVFLEPGTTRLKAVAFKDGLEPSSETFSVYKLANASFGPDGYVFCAYEDGFDCDFTGEASVAFGGDGLFNYLTVTDGTPCTAAVFGDPNPGAEKRCYYTYNIPAELPSVTVYNAGFEKPATANYQAGPMTNGWYFNVRAGVQRNGGQFAASLAPQGSQTAFMVGRNFIGAEISQRINFKEGEYELWFSMASRQSAGSELPFDVYFDDTLIGSFQPSSTSFTVHKTNAFEATAGYHTIKFIGAATEEDRTVFIDAVKIRTAGMSPPPPDVPDPIPPEQPLESLSNAGFEQPSVATHRAGPMKFSWNFNQWAGVQKNGGAFVAPLAPEGIQTAYLQTVNSNFGEINQYFNFEPGEYKLDFAAAKRTTGGGRPHSFDVYFDDTLIGSYTVTSGDFAMFATDTFISDGDAHRIRFVGQHTPGQPTTGESTAFIDMVSLRAPSEAPPELTPTEPPPPEPEPSLGNTGFEAPEVASHRAGPMKYSWNFNQWSGVQKNGGSFAAELAPEGVQTAYLQTSNGNFGEISQYFNVGAGTYKLEFKAAKRTTSGGKPQSFDIYFDDSLVGSYTVTSAGFQSYSTNKITASEGAHTIKFVAKHTPGESTIGESTAFIDEIVLRDASNDPPVMPAFVNAGFEEPDVASHRVGPMTYGWTFTTLAGVQANGGSFAAATAPEGKQTAFLQTSSQSYGQISQSIVFEAGTYKLEFQAAKRTTSGGRAQSFDVYFGDTVIGSYTVTEGSFQSYETASFTAAAGTHEIKFVAKQTEGLSTLGQSTAFIDSATIVAAEVTENPGEPSGEPVAALTGPSSVNAGEDFELTLGIEDVGEGYRAVDVIVHYDPDIIEFDTEADEDNHLVLASHAIQSLSERLQVIGTAVKPELGQIRIIMLGTGEPVAEDGNILALQGKAKSAAVAGLTAITLSDFTISDEVPLQVSTELAVLNVQVNVIDRADLIAAIASAQALHNGATEGTQNGQYPYGSKSAFNASIQAAIAVRDNAGASQSDISGAADALQQAVVAFQNSIITVTPINKAALNTAIAAARAKHDAAADNGKLGHYEPGAKAALWIAIGAAENVRDQAGASQAQVDQAITDLNAAVAQLAAKLVTLVDGGTRISIADLSIVAQYFGVDKTSSNWSEIEIADLFGEEEITIRVLAAVARMILDEWLAQ